MAPIMSDPPLPRRTESGMATRAVNAAAGVLHASMKRGRQIPTSLAIDLDSACLLNSPEAATELQRLRAEAPILRARVEGLEAQAERRRQRLAAAEADLLTMRGLLSPSGEPRRVPAEVEIHERVTPAVEWLLSRVAELEQALAAKDRPADEDPIAYALTEKADGITRRIAPTQALQLEDPHDSPLHHAYAVGRDLPEVTL